MVYKPWCRLGPAALGWIGRDTSGLAMTSGMGILGAWALRELEGAGLGRGT